MLYILLSPSPGNSDVVIFHITVSNNATFALDVSDIRVVMQNHIDTIVVFFARSINVGTFQFCCCVFPEFRASIREWCCRVVTRPSPCLWVKGMQWRRVEEEEEEVKRS